MGTDANNGGKSQTPVKRKHDDSLMLVSPGESGSGLPYAPEDWPNPGDVWSWKVGKRYTTRGFFQDRFISAPERLQDKPTRKLTFASKQSLERHFRSAFPDADINKFFASFSWDIPAKTDSNNEEPNSKGKSLPSPEVLATSPVKSMANGGGSTKRSQKGSLKKKASPKKKGKVSTDDGNIDLSINVFSGEEETPAGGFERGHSSYDNGGAPVDFKLDTNGSLENSQPTLTPEEFDSYLNCLDEFLSLPLPPIDEPSYQSASTVDVRKKLSSLLAMGFTSLISSDKVSVLTALTFKLQNDPSLSSKELTMLKLIQEIPFTRKCFLEAKEVSSQADKFFANLETKIASIGSLKEEYNTSKEEIEAAQASEASTLLSILDIDQQLAHLQSRKQALTETAKAINKKINELSSTQKRVMDCLPKIVQEVQIANSEKSGWERKREKAAEEEAEILAKFAPLEGFSF